MTLSPAQEPGISTFHAAKGVSKHSLKVVYHPAKPRHPVSKRPAAARPL
ncbi:hypothetical protein PO124_31580 [Bacillus licheniformis]|nr:hypothetical protein [Bacillus licheniformis]